MQKKSPLSGQCVGVSQSGIVEECEVSFMSGCNNELGSPDYLLHGGEIIKPVIESHELIRKFDKTAHGTLCQQTSSESLWILQWWFWSKRSLIWKMNEHEMTRNRFKDIWVGDFICFLCFFSPERGKTKIYIGHIYISVSSVPAAHFSPIPYKPHKLCKNGDWLMCSI